MTFHRSGFAIIYQHGSLFDVRHALDREEVNNYAQVELIMSNFVNLAP